MITLALIAWLCLCLVISLPAWALFTLLIAAQRQTRDTTTEVAPPLPNQRLAVLIPAHNESTNLIPTLNRLRKSQRDSDQIIVIADNCDDDTAAIARQHGAVVLERKDTTRRGKGFALAYGVDYLRTTRVDAVAIVDADCFASLPDLRLASAQACAADRPVQMLYTMDIPVDADLRTRLLAFAWVVKNKVRALGTQRLGGVCHLMGTGMVFPWHLIAKAQLATGHITEDMKLGIDLAIEGHAPIFNPHLMVASQFNVTPTVAKGQKSRWEHGHLQSMIDGIPRLIKAWFRKPSKATATLLIDLTIPPTTAYVLGLSLTTVIALLVGAVMQHPIAWLAAMALLISGSAMAIGIGLAWHTAGRSLITPREWARLPGFILWKLPIYLAFAIGRRSGWVRTER